jgi:uncharacterized protein YlxW (UPF0749 family)
MTGPPARRPWTRIGRALRRRPSRGQAVVAALCGLLAFALVTQVQATSDTSGLAAARPDDLLAILADLDSRSERLRSEIAELQETERQLASGSGQDSAALAAARERAQTLGILTGALPAVGPGVVLTITDPGGEVRADVLVDALQELRDAGAEAIQLSGVRVVASTALVDAQGGIAVGSRRVSSPYRFAVIGDPRTLAAALAIPGGVIDTVRRRPGAAATVVRSPRVSVTALQVLTAPRYARPTRR